MEKERPLSEDNCMDVTWSGIAEERIGQAFELSHILGPALKKTGHGEGECVKEAVK